MQLQFRELDYFAPQKLFKLLSHEKNFIFFDGDDSQSQVSRYSFIAIRPLKVYSCWPNSHNENNALLKFTQFVEEWQNLLGLNKSAYDQKLPPFIGGLAGFFSYDLACALANINLVQGEETPYFCLGLYNKVFAFDKVLQKVFVFFYEIDGFENIGSLNQLLEICDKARSLTDTEDNDSMPALELTSSANEKKYVQKFALIHEHIYNGNVYEVNLAQKFVAKIPENYPATDLYLRLSKKNKAPFSAYLNFTEIEILSSSPERFIAIRDDKIETRPIKGTIRRYVDEELDLQQKQSLATDPKELAENVMIVDLLRNDLGKVCSPGTIKVDKLCILESFANLHHLVSIVSGRLSSSYSVFEAILALFPGGSITGAPKRSAMQIIQQLEGFNRGVYCGTIGYISFNQTVDLSIAIRTITIKRAAKTLEFCSGSAVTISAHAKSEYNELLLKLENLLLACNGKII